MSQFCHLHVHSRYSFLDGLAPVDRLAARAAELEQPALALTDHGVLFGAVQFFKACENSGIKAIIGMEAYEAVPHAWDFERDAVVFKDKYDKDRPRYFHLTLWAHSLVGWRNLCALHTKSFTADYKPKNQPLIDRANLELHSEGVGVGLGCMQSRTNQAIARGGDGYEQAKWYREVFGDRLVVEVMANLPEQQAILRPQRKLAKRLGVPCVATNDVHYLEQADGVEHGPHHVLVQARRWKRKQEKSEEGVTDKSEVGYGQWYGTDQFYLKSEQQMHDTGGFLDQELENTLLVADATDFQFSKVPKPSPPVAPIPEPGEDPEFDAFLEAA